MILYSEGATKAQEDEANTILEALTIAYPGHPWAVRVYDGGFFIRHLAFPTNWGMSCKFKKFGYSASALKREVIMKAGEWLERAGLARGRATDDEIVRVDGVPERFQPRQSLPEGTPMIVSPSGVPLRSHPRPQAINGD